MNKIKLNIVFCGEKNIGKTMFINKLLGNKNIFNKNTIGVDIKYFTTKFNNFEIENNLWDLSGDPVYRDIINKYFQIADLVILFINTNKSYSLDTIDNWIEKINKPIFIVNLGLYQYSKNGYHIYHLLEKEPSDIFDEIYDSYYTKYPTKFIKVNTKNIDVYYKLEEEPKPLCNCNIL